MSVEIAPDLEAAGHTAHERREQIARLVDDGGRVSVASLTARFGVTDASIRRDLILLEGEGRLRRVHGGAVSTAARLGAGAYAAKLRVRREEKARIAAAAARLVSPGEIVLFDSGTTVAQVAAHMPAALRAPSAITAVTYSLPVVDEIGAWESPHLVVVGGLYLPEYRAFVGPGAIEALRALTADTIFVGCDGLSAEAGLTTPHVLVAEVGGVAVSRCRRVVAVADSTKLGRQGFTPIIPLSSVDVLITDADADADRVAAIRAAGVEVVLA